MLAFIFPVSRFVRAIVLDKERRVKETMKIMGLKPSVRPGPSVQFGTASAVGVR